MVGKKNEAKYIKGMVAKNNEAKYSKGMVAKIIKQTTDMVSYKMEAKYTSVRRVTIKTLNRLDIRKVKFTMGQTYIVCYLFNGHIQTCVITNMICIELVA